MVKKAERMAYHERLRNVCLDVEHSSSFVEELDKHRVFRRDDVLPSDDAERGALADDVKLILQETVC